MRKHIAAAALLTATMAMAAPPVDQLHTGTLADQPLRTSIGHNLTRQRPTAADATARAPKAAPGGRRAPLRAPMRATGVDHSNAALFESFESCSDYSNELPDGWTAIVDLQSDEPTDHWYGVSRAIANRYMFPGPVDGDMMISMGYSTEYKDEWLISPVFNVPEVDYVLSFYWYTVPYYLYVIDTDHVDFDAMEFTNREILFNLEVLVSVDGGEWTHLYDLESDFADIGYDELSDIDYTELQLKELDFSAYAGHDVQIAFRYYGADGNSVMLDAVSVDHEAPIVRYTPDISRQYYGICPNEYMTYMTRTIEFYPVEYPVTWSNVSDNDGVTYQWRYSYLGDDGELTYLTDDTQDHLEVTYHPDYTSEATLRNNLYYLPELRGRGAKTGTGCYKGRSDMLQAGGTAEFELEDGLYAFPILPFDVVTEGLGGHLEEDESLGLWAVPIFGYNINADAWWEHYSYPLGALGRKSYVDGFANLIIPHPQAPMVVYGASAVAYGIISPDIEFTLRVYTVDAEGMIDPEAIATATISGADVVGTPAGGLGHMVLPFRLEQPIVMSAQSVGMGYLVEVSGYHDPRITLFVPMQSLTPNAEGLCYGFYHHYAPFHSSLSEEMSYVAAFRTDDGRDLYSAFAIGLDAHYPWLEVYGDDSVTTDQGVATAMLRGYYDAAEYTVEVPEWLDVTLTGRYRTTVDMAVSDESEQERSGDVRITAPGVSATLHVTVPAADAGICDITGDGPRHGDVYTPTGVRVLRDATSDQLRALAPGVYLHAGRKVVVR